MTRAVPLDLRDQPGHGPLLGWAPQATAQDMAAYRAQGSVCLCTACQRYRTEQGITARDLATAGVGPTPRDQVDLVEGVAVHEAGHVLLALLQGVPTNKVWITKHWGGGASGATQVGGRLETRDDARKECLILMAGITAAAMWLHREHRYPMGEAREWGDQSGCDDRSKFAYWSQVAQLPEWTARAEVHSLLSANWARLMRGAGMLHRARQMRASRM